MTFIQTKKKKTQGNKYTVIAMNRSHNIQHRKKIENNNNNKQEKKKEKAIIKNNNKQIFQSTEFQTS